MWVETINGKNIPEFPPRSDRPLTLWYLAHEMDFEDEWEKDMVLLGNPLTQKQKRDRFKKEFDLAIEEWRKNPKIDGAWAPCQDKVNHENFL